MEYDKQYSTKKVLLIFSIYLNCALSLIDRVLQIVYYNLCDYSIDKVKDTLLCFILIKSISLIFIFLVYVITLKDDNISFGERIKFFIIYLPCQEFSFSLGVHYTLKSKYSKDYDSPLITTRLLNIFHLLFVSIPQILIITINSSANSYFDAVSIVSLLFSSIYIIWSITYQFVLCVSNQYEYDNNFNEILYD